ncbi:MAG: alpha/beta fold hydrolase [Phycisphaerae bacterium]|nr:alpha/beta fold hydrolase [Phycisphaerae bacterium]
MSHIAPGLWLMLAGTTLIAARPTLGQSAHHGVAPSFGQPQLTEGVQASPTSPAIPQAIASARPGVASRIPVNQRTAAVTLTAEDQVPLAGVYLSSSSTTGQPQPMAILIHGAHSDHTTWDAALGPLADAGFAVLAIDLRGHGRSATEQVPQADGATFRQMYKDVSAAYLWLRDQPNADPTRFVLVAAGAGCGIALDYTRRDRSVDGVILLSPGTDTVGPDLTVAAAKCGPRPLLMLISEPEQPLADRVKAAAPQTQVTRLAARPDPSATNPRASNLLGRIPGIEKTIVDAALRFAGPPATAPMVTSTRGQTYYAPNTNYARSLRPANLRWLSSPAEAEARGLHPPQSVLQQQGATEEDDEPGRP